MASSFRILIIDDTTEDLHYVKDVLEKQGYVVEAETSLEAGVVRIQNMPDDYDLLLLNNDITGVKAHNLFMQLKSYDETAQLPVLFIIKQYTSGTATRAFSQGASDYIVKPFNVETILARVETQLQLHQAKKLLAQHDIELRNIEKNKVDARADDFAHTQREMLYVMADLMDAQEKDVGKHSHRMSQVAALLARLHPELCEKDAQILLETAPMHDIGNISLPSEIVHKAGKYTDAEYEKIKTHTTIGYQLLSKSSQPNMQLAAIIAHEHQEKWDGTGYPRGLKGKEIHIYGRIVAFADVFDALMKQRSYKHAMTFDEAMTYMQLQKGKHFDPKLVEIFILHQDQFRRIFQSK